MSRIVSNQTQNAAGEYFYIPATADIQAPYGGVYATLESRQLSVTQPDANLQQGIAYDPRIFSSGTTLNFDISGALPFESRNALTLINNTNNVFPRSIEIDLNGGFGALPIGTYFYLQNLTPAKSVGGAYEGQTSFVSIDENNVKTQLGVSQAGDASLIFFLYTSNGWVRNKPALPAMSYVVVDTTDLTPIPIFNINGFINTYNATNGQAINIDITAGGVGLVPGNTWMIQQTNERAQAGNNTNLCLSGGEVIATLYPDDFHIHSWIYSGTNAGTTYGFLQLY
jgi:hypothetical protein